MRKRGELWFMFVPECVLLRSEVTVEGLCKQNHCRQRDRGSQEWMQISPTSELGQIRKGMMTSTHRIGRLHRSWQKPNCLGLDTGIMKREESRSSRGVSKRKKKVNRSLGRPKGGHKSGSCQRGNANKKKGGAQGERKKSARTGEKKGREWKS